MTFSFVQITDHHLGESDDDQPYGYPAAATFRGVMDRISEDCSEEIDFIVSTGDLVNRPTDAAYQFLKDLLNLTTASEMACPHSIRYGKLWDFPMYLLPGNHDARPAFFHNLFNSVESELFNTNFTHKGIRFVCLDWGAYDRGTLVQETLQYAEAELSASEPAVLLMHHNIVPLGRVWLDRFIPDGIEAFYETLRRKNVLGILCGHLHTSYERSLDGIPVLGLRSTAFQFRFEEKPKMALQPPHYRVVTVHPEGRLETRVVEVPLP